MKLLIILLSCTLLTGCSITSQELAKPEVLTSKNYCKYVPTGISSKQQRKVVGTKGSVKAVPTN